MSSPKGYSFVTALVCYNWTMEELERAQLIINMFRRHVYELTERLIAEQVAHESTKQELNNLRSAAE